MHHSLFLCTSSCGCYVAFHSMQISLCSSVSTGVMAVFENCIVLLDVKGLPLKEKKKLRLALLDNGGNIAYVINKQVCILLTIIKRFLYDKVN